MKILVVMDHPGGSPFFPALRLLAERGHEVHLGFSRVKTRKSHEQLIELAESCPGLTFGVLAAPVNSGWIELARRLRLGSDYLRYLEPRYRGATKLRARAEDEAPTLIRWLGRLAALAGQVGVVGLRRALQSIERCLLPPSAILDQLRERNPDLVLITPLVERGSGQADWLRAARRLGIRTVYPVLSWDNLTNKGLIRDVPDLVLLWNEFQAREAEELHGIPPERIQLTGAPPYDYWFDWGPARSREDFCREVGLRADRPFVLYVCSSGFIAPGEQLFVERWLTTLRSFGEPFVEAGFLVRPHPLMPGRFASGELEGMPQVSVWPRLGEEPLDNSARRNYFDSIYHAAAVVGINTSAQIESAIVGRPVHTLLADEFRETQEGTLHFHYLSGPDGPLLTGRTFEEHAAQLAESMLGHTDRRRNRRFVERFVRPLGLETPATPVFVEAIESLGGEPPRTPDSGPALAPIIRFALRPAAALASRRSARRKTGRADGATPARDLRRNVRRLAAVSNGTPVVAGPWLGDEVDELLYWIPYLRWAETAALGLRERLVVLHRSPSACWYEGLAFRQVAIEELLPADELEMLVSRFPENGLDDRARTQLADALGVAEGFAVLPSGPVLGARSQLASQVPTHRLNQRLLQFALLSAPDLPPGTELPRRFVALRFGFERSVNETPESLATALAVVELAATYCEVVLLDPPEHLRACVLDRAGIHALGNEDHLLSLAVIGRAACFLGSYGPYPYLASLMGVPALGICGSGEGIPAEHLRTAQSFLGHPPFGRLALSDIGDEALGAARLLFAETLV